MTPATLRTFPPFFIPRAAFDAYVAVPLDVTGQEDEAGRLWDIVWMLRFAIRKAAQGQDRCRSHPAFATTNAVQNW